MGTVDEQKRQLDNARRSIKTLRKAIELDSSDPESLLRLVHRLTDAVEKYAIACRKDYPEKKRTIVRGRFGRKNADLIHRMVTDKKLSDYEVRVAVFLALQSPQRSAAKGTDGGGRALRLTEIAREISNQEGKALADVDTRSVKKALKKLREDHKYLACYKAQAQRPPRRIVNYFYFPTPELQVSAPLSDDDSFLFAAEQNTNFAPPSSTETG